MCDEFKSLLLTMLISIDIGMKSEKIMDKFKIKKEFFQSPPLYSHAGYEDTLDLIIINYIKYEKSTL